MWKFASLHDFYDRCPVGPGCHDVKISVYLYKFFLCAVTSIQPLIGPKLECHIIEEVIEVDELNEGKQDK